MLPRKRVLYSLSGKKTDHIAYAPLITRDAVCGITGYDPFRYNYDPCVSSYSQEVCQQRCGYDWILFVGGLYTERELSSLQHLRDGSISITRDNGTEDIITQSSERTSPLGIEDIERLRVPPVSTYPAIAKAESSRERGIFVCAGIRGPFQASYLVGYERFLEGLVTEPSFVRRLLDYGMQLSYNQALSAMQSGADGILLLESNVSPDIIGPKIYRELVAPRERELVEALHSEKVLVFHHLCAQNPSTIPTDAVLSIGFDAIGLEQGIDLSPYRGRTCLLGNINTTTMTGEISEVEREFERLVKDGTDGIILSSSCAMLPGTPAKNIKRINDLRKER